MGMIYSDGNIPPNPIGGWGCNNLGYNSGYYNQMNGYGYTNPYLEAEIKRQEEIQAKEQLDHQVALIRNITKSHNPEMSAEEIDTICGCYDTNQVYDYYGDRSDEMEVSIYLQNSEYLYNINRNSPIMNPNGYIDCEKNYEAMMEEQRSLGVPDDCDLFDYMNKYGNIISYNNLEKERKAEKMRSVNTLFDKGQFDAYLDQYCQSSFHDMFSNNRQQPQSSLSPITSIDDLEYNVPNPFEKIESERRARFEAKIRENALNL